MAGIVSADWAWLPRDLLDSIIDRVVELSDFISFGSVCKPWHSTTQQCHRQQLLHLLKTCRNQLPMLLTSAHDNSDNNRNLYGADGSVYSIQMPIPCNRRFSGSSQGWLFMVDKCMNITLINPVLNETITLPQFKVPGEDYLSQYKEYDDHDYFIIKATLLPQKRGEDFEVLLIYGGMSKLAYLKSRDEAWKCIMPKANNEVQLFSDIICYKGLVYAVSLFGSLVLVDVTSGSYKNVIEATEVSAKPTYMVESHYGNLLRVRRILDWQDDYKIHKTVKFEVFKLSRRQVRKPKWVRLKRIGKQALFLGSNYSMSISTRDFPQYRSNCIYYVDDFFVMNHYVPRVDDDSGIYNMEDKSFSKHFVPNPDPSFCPSLPQIWIVPKVIKI